MKVVGNLHKLMKYISQLLEWILTNLSQCIQGKHSEMNWGRNFLLFMVNLDVHFKI